MIARLWHGRVSTAKAGSYRAFLNGRAIPDYRSVPGNISVHVLERQEGDITHFITLTLRDSLESIRASSTTRSSGGPESGQVEAVHDDRAAADQAGHRIDARQPVPRLVPADGTRGVTARPGRLRFVAQHHGG